jgi:hypothetical protein
MLRRSFTWLSVGVALGLFATMWFGPALIQWWWQVPGSNPAFACDPQIRSATEWLVKIQLGVGLSAGIVLAILANVVARWRALKQSASQASTAIEPRS